MNVAAELKDLVGQPFSLLQEMEERSRATGAGKDTGNLPGEWVGIGFRIEQEKFVADREQVREVLMLPDTLARVPGAKRWMLGIANLRSHLLPLVDLKMLLGSGRTALQRETRVILVNHREIPAGLVVDEVFGLRRFTADEFDDLLPETAVRCERYLRGAYLHGSENWPLFGLHDLLESATFLQASAD